MVRFVFRFLFVFWFFCRVCSVFMFRVVWSRCSVLMIICILAFIVVFVTFFFGFEKYLGNLKFLGGLKVFYFDWRVIIGGAFMRNILADGEGRVERRVFIFLFFLYFGRRAYVGITLLSVNSVYGFGVVVGLLEFS